MNNYLNQSLAQLLSPIENKSSTGFNIPLIAGPCSAESKEQVFEVAQELIKLPYFKIFRAGVWKPRTRPNTFDGQGDSALPWLKEIQDTYNIPVAIEVAHAHHVELALKFGIKIVWIGARTTVNPFSVQEIAESLRGTKQSVMIKNPMNPEMSLWMGAIERMENVGLTDLAVIHRGFSSYEKTLYRYRPIWKMLIEMKRLRPELPLICDPSHIAGKREFLGEVIQKAVDLNCNSLMIETHPTPETALSDADQQLTPLDLKNLLENQVLMKSPKTTNPQELLPLEEWRQQIDHLDAELIETLFLRMQVVDQIATFKQDKKITPFQIERLSQLIKDRVEMGQRQNLNSDFITALFELIHLESLKKQSQIID